MKKIFILLLIVTVPTIFYAQTNKGISTNPLNPINEEFLPLKNQWYSYGNPYTVNSFLNTTVNWYPPSSIAIDLSQNWSSPVGNGTGVFNMTNPYSSDHAYNHLNSLPNAPNDDDFKDYRWEDGWELLWINLRKHFNGDPLGSPSPGTYFATGDYGDPITPEIAPSNIPYFVLYNRYRGVIRLFANVWQDNLNTSFQEMAVTMKYLESPTNISGLLRHASQFDRALDQATEFNEIIGPRFQYINSSDWLVAEFQMAFDPCICMREFDGQSDPGNIEFVFETIETLSIDMMSRTIETDDAINSNNLNEDFLNLSGIDPNNYQPGTVMYKRMEDMFSTYQSILQSYNNDLNDYNDSQNDLKWDLIDIGKTLVTQGLNYVLPMAGTAMANLMTNASIPADTSNSSGGGATKTLNNALKGIVGNGVDYASFELFGKKPTMPVKPTAPVASFSETFYRGNIQKSFFQRTPPLLIPGGIDIHNPSPGTYMGYGKMRLSPRNFSAYNKILGQAALLKTPDVSFFLILKHLAIL